MSIMPLMMLDLDNTLIDRDAAFRSAATEFLDVHRLPGDDLGWLMAADASGYTARPILVEAIVARYGGGVTVDVVRALTDMGAADRVVLAEATGTGEWPMEVGFRPTHTARDAASAIRCVLENPR